MSTQVDICDDSAVLAELKKSDVEMMAKRDQSGLNVDSEFRVDSDDCLRLKDRICVSRNPELIQMILNEAHHSRLVVHPGSTKMYNDLKQFYWWHGMKRDISEFFSRCLVCQQVKV
ncbi:Retrotransposon protein [Gossypium australe]|uniref:Retrotransposon protein n=1 Tax=Gossypium australe TaxID=47621 RepID=A0A5B6W6B8_9ROSI|nr:Retrotransposon protein [Gossypium australe]